MAQPSPGPCDESPLETSPPPASKEVGHDDNGAAIHVAMKMEKKLDHLLEILKGSGKETNGERARIIEEVARIKAEAVNTREAMEEARRKKDEMEEARRKLKSSWRTRIAPATTTVYGLSLLTVALASYYSGFFLGAKAYVEALMEKLGPIGLGVACLLSPLFRNDRRI